MLGMTSIPKFGGEGPMGKRLSYGLSMGSGLWGTVGHIRQEFLEEGLALNRK